MKLRGLRQWRARGIVWCPPYRLEVGKYLKAGENQIRIEVANTAMNFMAATNYRTTNCSI